MATNSGVKSVHATLTGAGVDTANLTQPWDKVEVLNRDPAVTMYFTVDGTVPTVGAANTEVVLPNQANVVRGALRGTTGNFHSIQIIGNGNAYSVTGIAGI